MSSKRKSKLLIVLFLILCLIICLLLIDYFVLLSPKNNIKRFFNETYLFIDNKLVDIKNKNINSLISKGNFTINSNIKEYSNLNGYSLIYDIEYDKKNKAGLLDIKLGDTEESLSGKLLYSNSDLYVSFPYLISSIVKIPVNDKKLEFDLKYDDILYLVDNVNTILIKNIESSNNISKSIQKTNIKTTYRIDKNEFDNIVDDIYSDTKLNIILNNKLNISLDMIKSSFKDNYYIDLIVYTNLLNRITKFEILNDKIYIKYESNMLNVLYNNNEVFNLSINNDNYKFTIKYKNTIINFDIKASNLDNGINYNGNITIETKNNKNIKIDVFTGISVNVPLSEIDISESKDVSQLTESDLNVINDALSLFENYFIKN